MLIRTRRPYAKRARRGMAASGRSLTRSQRHPGSRRLPDPHFASEKRIVQSAAVRRATAASPMTAPALLGIPGAGRRVQWPGRGLYCVGTSDTRQPGRAPQP
ncbi:hypothetical protein E2C01_065544 [Portunus trituberculatus]|uniref:Uncharacterized protein n=1 Tax=Portunus trituberculatus TaxID=210409 RepID=A0A5B7HJ47_PORTR|nr:hypothetical protein [Portunus trituberculatus]